MILLFGRSDNVVLQKSFGGFAMMTRKEAFEKILEAHGIVDLAQTLEAFELLADGAQPVRVVEAIESLRHGFDLLHYIGSDLSEYEAEYEAEFGCKPTHHRLGRRY